ncbi:M4 family metallopeptidase (plasmid) [Bacillus cereus]|uniref:M4 family metallopeptidase n=1 Tax=Bacillus cereus TaxID=1396 RepID=UPI0021CAFCB6|nr:M4 family metallopeptidase [Bacillus cereus]MCU7757136.1 M4 family metallopeptidase [Bacillus cereus]UXP17664.1 M4 family metallopeptidase [Bacillus cereus]
MLEAAQNVDWLTGDKILGPKFSGKALRSMKEPGTANKHDSQPNHMDKYDDGSNHNFETEDQRQSYLVSMEIGTDNSAILWYTA